MDKNLMLHMGSIFAALFFSNLAMCFDVCQDFTHEFTMIADRPMVPKEDIC